MLMTLGELNSGRSDATRGFTRLGIVGPLSTFICQFQVSIFRHSIPG